MVMELSAVPSVTIELASDREAPTSLHTCPFNSSKMTKELNRD